MVLAQRLNIIYRLHISILLILVLFQQLFADTCLTNVAKSYPYNETVSFNLSIIFHNTNDITASAGCNQYFGCGKTCTADTLQAIDNIFYSVLLLYTNVSDSFSINKPPETNLNGNVELVNCSSVDNVVTASTYFATLIIDDTNFMDHFYIDSSRSLHQYFNHIISLTFLGESITIDITSIQEHIVIKKNWHSLHLLFLLLIPISIIIIIIIYCRRAYMNAFIVNKALVLIIGISQFDDKQKFLPGVNRAVTILKKLWSEMYQYDVFVCNQYSLYSTKQDIIDFIDSHSYKLSQNSYQCVIVHIISHGTNGGFLCSDEKNLTLAFIQHEIQESAYEQDQPLLQCIFYHVCRGTDDYYLFDYSDPTDNKDSKKNIKPESEYQSNVLQWHSISNLNTDEVSLQGPNWAIVYNNVPGRTISDQSNFTQCIYEVFGNNLRKWMKYDLRTILVQIRRQLEKETKGAEICNVNETLQYAQIRLEPAKLVSHKHNSDSISMSPMSDNTSVEVTFWNRYNILRIFIILITALFMCISIIYAFSWIIEPELNTWFCEPKSLEQIKKHSIQLQLNGGTTDDCWTTSTNKLDLEKLFYAKSYSGYRATWIAYNFECVMSFVYFILASLAAVIMFGYFPKQLQQDWMFDARHWYQTSLMKKKSRTFTVTNYKKLNYLIIHIRHRYKKITASDSKTWILITLLTDNCKLILQTLVFFRYGGAQNTTLYNEINTAETPKYVILFAVYLSLHYIIMAITWICYVFKQDICIGKRFKYSVWTINLIFDVLYFTFPLLLTNWLTTMRIDSAIIPVYFICWKICNMWLFVTTLARNKVINQVLPKHYNLSLQMVNLIATEKDNIKDDSDTMSHNKWLNGELPNLSNTKLFWTEFCKRFVIILLTLIWISLGVWILSFTITHFNESIIECNDYDSFKSDYPELFLWKHCNYKVYPFFTENGLRCNCRGFMLDSANINEYNSLKNQTINGEMIESLLSHWHMLETFKITGNANLIKLNLTHDTLQATNMRAVQIDSVTIVYIDAAFGDGWKNLQFLSLNASLNIPQQTTLPKTFSKLTKITYLELSYSNINNIDVICTMKNLKTLILRLSPIHSLPHCLYDFPELFYLDLSGAALKYIDSQIFTMKSLQTILLFLSRNTIPETFAVGNDSDFNYDSSKTHLFYGSGICLYYSGTWKINNSFYWYEMDTYYPYLYRFINDTGACNDHFSYAHNSLMSGICFPEQYSNGICDLSCNNYYFRYDGGDCNQLCQCNSTLLSNNICDVQCNSTYCNYDEFDCLERAIWMSGLDDMGNSTGSLCTKSTSSPCYYEWIGDGICDDNCRYENECLNDQTDCDGCTKTCSTYWSLFELWSNVVIADYLMQIEEFCIAWGNLQPIATLDHHSTNCSWAFKMVDINPYDGVVSAFEFTDVLLLQHDQDIIPNYSEKLYQINCSLCAPSTSIYYHFLDND
eukprot:379876_1